MSFRRLSVLVRHMPAGGALEAGIERIRRRAEEADYRARESRYLAHKEARERALAARQEGG